MNKQVEEWMGLAITPETRALIRRWARIERVLGVMVAVDAGLCALMLAVSIYLSVFREDLIGHLWWLWPAVVGVLLVFLVPWFAANNKRVDAMYADGRESVGTVTEADYNDPDPGPSYDLTITAAVSGNRSIRRVTRRDEAPRVGQQVRFRHNTLDPEDLEDVLFVGFVDEDARERRKQLRP